MIIRIISSIIAFPIFALFIFMGGPLLEILIAIMSCLAMYELLKVLFKKIIPIHFINFLFLFIYYLLLNNFSQKLMLSFLFIYAICNLICLVIGYGKIKIYDIACNMFSFFYVVVLMSTIYLVRELEYGQYLVWLIFISAWGSDTFAYFTGVFFGKHKLTPKLSPKKTIEGSIGGIIGAVILSIIYSCFIYNKLGYNKIDLALIFSVITFIASILSQFGDLTASAIKRDMDVKDYGKIIPGHGGVMDRFDSILFTAPIIYIIIEFLI